MKFIFKRGMSVILVLLLVVMMVPTSASAAVKISKSKVTIEVGKSTTLKITGTNKAVKWKTSNKKVATVSKNGKVTANKYGTATITATVDNKNYTCKVTAKYDNDIMLMNTYNWIVSDLWNDSFCDIYHYVDHGTDAVGDELDIEKAITNADKAMKKADLYDDFINSLKKSEYQELKDKWIEIRTEIDMLYNTIKDETPRASDKTYIFDKDNFNTYMYDLMSLIY